MAATPARTRSETPEIHNIHLYPNSVALKEHRSAAYPATGEPVRGAINTDDECLRVTLREHDGAFTGSATGIQADRPGVT